MLTPCRSPDGIGEGVLSRAELSQGVQPLPAPTRAALTPGRVQPVAAAS